MRRPKLLDLMGFAGGAGEGYARAGFEVLGVDLVRSPRAKHPTLVADVLDLPIEFLRMFDAIHASPPCQGYTSMRHAPGAKGAPRLIGQVREMLIKSGRPYVIENVEMARADMRNPVLLCGSMFGLGAAGHQLRRHRLFEASFPLKAPCACAHTSPVIGVYGGHVRCRSAKHGGRGTKDFVGFDKPALAREAMGIDWMSMEEISEAIPPRFTQWVGRRLFEHLNDRRRVAA